MRMKYAAVAALSTMASAALFASPALADPGSPNSPHHLKQIKKTPATRALAADEPAWVQTVRDGITLDSRSTPVTVTPTTGTRLNTRSDFDGDGRDDIAAASDSGVVVNYSSAAHRDQLRTELLEDGCACFGNSLASGNFNGDGYDDLAIADLDEIDTATKGLHAGAVWIFYGGPDGLQISTVQHFNQSSAGVPGSSEEDDYFGGALAAGDITGDGRDDLAIGLPNEAVGSIKAAGGVIVLKGSASGIVSTGALWIDQGTSGVPGSPETDDNFGWAMTIGKINKDKYGDLAIGTPFENYHDTNVDGTGMITQFWGGSAGVSLTGATSVSGEGITHTVKVTGTYVFDLGLAMGITDTNGDGYGEIIVGDSGVEVAWKRAPGAVVSLVGRSTGLSTTGVKVISQESSGVSGSAEQDDWFGDSIGVGDVTGDGLGDVLVGVPGEDIGSAVDAGLVTLLRGSSSGLTGTGSQSLDQSSTLVPGSAESYDYFADSVTLLNLNGTGPLEALAGTPGEVVTGDAATSPSGSMTTFPTSSQGLGTGTTWSGRSLVPTGETMSAYGWNLVARQG